MTMHRLSLTNSVFEGANTAYLFDGEETVLLDTGVAIDETREELEAGLAEHGVSVTDLDAIVLTHYHADHSGLAGELQAESDASVYAHHEDAALIAGDEQAWDELETIHHQRFEEWGMPVSAREELLSYLGASEDAGIYGETVDVTPIAGGETLQFDDLAFEVLHTPGHTAGHCCFVPTGAVSTLSDELSATNGTSAIFTGDALLPQYTPNVGGADVRLEQSLECYIRTLETLIDRDFDIAWPGHREPIQEPTERARYVLEHHETRAYRVAKTLEAEGPANAWEVSDELFGDLENIHILHGPGEAAAHLEHLHATGAVTREEGRYRLSEFGKRQLDECPDERWPLESTSE